MQQTANYNLNLPEGTDIVNPLVDYNPNFTVIDGAMKANADRTVGRATCVKSGTTHAVTRSNTGSNIINFTATGDWNTGDSMTVDGTPVSVYLPDGSAPLTGAYVINSEVIAVINGIRVTLYGAQEIPDYTASDVSYDNSGSGIAASDVQGAIDALANEIADIPSNDFLMKNGVVYTAVGQTIPANSSYTAPADGYYNIGLKSGGMFFLDAARLVSIIGNSTDAYVQFIVPLKAGTTIYSRSTGDHLINHYIAL